MPDWIGDLLARLPVAGMELRLMQRALIAVALLCPVCALLGVPVVNLRLAFFSDAVGHAALTGMVVGLLLGIGTQAAVVLLALAMAAAILVVLRRSRLSTDTVIGVLAAGTVAAGLALIPHVDANRARAATLLYGDVLTVADGDLVLLALLALAAVGLLAWRSNRLLALALNADLARAHGRAGAADRWLFALVLAMATALAVRIVGVLLVTALLVVPAATARNLAGSAARQPWIAGGLGLACGVGGLLLSAQPWAGTASGPTIVLLAVALFGLSLVPAAWRQAGAQR